MGVIAGKWTDMPGKGGVYIANSKGHIKCYSSEPPCILLRMTCVQFHLIKHKVYIHMLCYVIVQVILKKYILMLMPLNNQSNVVNPKQTGCAFQLWCTATQDQ